MLKPQVVIYSHSTLRRKDLTHAVCFQAFARVILHQVTFQGQFSTERTEARFLPYVKFPLWLWVTSLSDRRFARWRKMTGCCTALTKVISPLCPFTLKSCQCTESASIIQTGAWYFSKSPSPKKLRSMALCQHCVPGVQLKSSNRTMVHAEAVQMGSEPPRLPFQTKTTRCS